MPSKNNNKRLLLVRDSNNQVIYTIEKNKKIGDIFGNTIASFKEKTKIKRENKKVKASVYKDENNVFECIENQLFLNDAFVGIITKKNKKSSNLFLLFLTNVLLFGAILFVLLIGFPELKTEDPYIAFQVEDTNGSWEEQGTVAVFDTMIYPGSSGKYEFVMSNESNVQLQYTFSLNEKYIGNANFNSFMEYRLKMNNEYIHTMEWVNISNLIYSDLVFLPNTKQLMMLEWRWPFEAGKDEEDTSFGLDAGKYFIVLNINAKVYS